MRSPQSNLAYVRACLAELRDYERAEPLFWTLSSRPPAGSPPFLQMTIGNLVLALDEALSLGPGLNAADRTALTRAHAEWEARWSGRSVLLETKAVRELDSRISQWREYVRDKLESGDLSDYAGSLRPRLGAVRLLDLLGAGHARAPAALAELAALDAALEAHLAEGPCALGDAMSGVYPFSPRYRFLYRRPR